MAVSINTIKNWFRRGLRPTESQFSYTWDSFWHKEEQIPIESVENLQETLDDIQNQINNIQSFIGYNSESVGIVFRDFVNANSPVEGNVQILEPNVVGWFNGAIATRAINGDNYIEWTLDDTNAVNSMGLTNQYPGISVNGLIMDIWVDIFTDINTGENTVIVFEDGEIVNPTPFPNWFANDIFKINYNGGVVTVLVNDVVIYTSSKTYTLPLNPIGLVLGRNTGSLLSEVQGAKFGSLSNLSNSTL